MVRSFATALALSCLVSFAWAQSQPAPGTAVAPAGKPAAKSAAIKPAPKNKSAAKPPAPADNGPCQVGVIPAVGDLFAVKKIGLTVFGNEEAEVPVDAWGLDDLVVARVRAALGPGTRVRRIAYTKAAFAPYDHPAPSFFQNPEENLTTAVRQIAANAGCERYFVFTKFEGKVDGTNQTTHGIGVLTRGAGLLSSTSLFANVQLTAFDGQTFAVQKKPIDLGTVLAGTFAHMLRDPLTQLDDSAFPEPAAAAPASATLRDHTKVLLAATLDKILLAYLKQE
jgi:hypothetical protein